MSVAFYGCVRLLLMTKLHEKLPKFIEESIVNLCGSFYKVYYAGYIQNTSLLFISIPEKADTRHRFGID